ncbi:MAG TPA: outer membrane lipoprotein-sorting protein [Bryobacteraceae bacterium]|nr:outer membrane lipoprotein-sorting protein [Bryobacteraceae bacterium]
MSKWPLLLALLAAGAQDARQIVEESQKRHRSQSQQYDGVLQVFNPNGKNSEKRWQFFRSGNYGDSKALLRFVNPPEVKGVALLIVNHPERASDQWMWLPELQRDRRVALQDRSTRFFGTDFSYEDLEERDVSQSDFRLLGEETLDGHACWKIESTPKKGKFSQYGRVVSWMRKDIYFPVQYEMYVKEQMVRRLQYRRIERVNNVWSALEMEMFDLRRKGRTVLRTEKLQYNIPLKDELFTLQALRRGE